MQVQFIVWRIEPIYFYDGATDATFTNESGGIIYNTSTFATVQIDTNSTLVNSGTMK